MKTYVYLFFCLFSLMGFQACSNDEVDNVKTTTSNDVLSIGGAGIIWGTAFGALSMGAGAAASLVFLLMAEALC